MPVPPNPQCDRFKSGRDVRAPGVFILVTHLLGVGHLARMCALARGLAANGHRVTLASGGRPAPLIGKDGFDFVQLPSVHCVGVDFHTLLAVDGTPISDEARQTRIDQILAALEACDPDVIVTETYPFGRRQLAAEFRALLEAARRRARPPAVLSSIRDILNPPAKSSRAAEAEEVLARFYDGVLVHGDSLVTPLSASWPASKALEKLLTYTGYIADTGQGPISPIPSDDILVSGGGSAASLPLYHAAIGAADMLDRPYPWRILVGHGVAAGDFEALAAKAGPKVTVERARPDFPALLAGAVLSVSQAGYNTMIDLGRAGIPAVVVPFEQGKEAEQRLRAERFHALGLAGIVSEAELTPERLAMEVTATLDRPRATVAFPGIAGVANSMKAIEVAALHAEAEAAAWARLDTVLAARGEIRLWWRDDDAIAATPALDRLLDLARRHDVPLALAVIPAEATPALAERLASEPLVDVLVHGYSHASHAPDGRKKQELGYRPLPEMKAELQQALSRLQGLFGPRCLPVLVPPWNRIDPALVKVLPACGFRGLSVSGDGPGEACDDLAVANIRFDPIDWKNGGGLINSLTLLRQFTQMLEAGEPLGILTHHLVHDPWIWAFLDRLLEKLKQHTNLRFMRAAELFV
ncbi:glycosyltransferase [Labrys okinawensis]|uniref:glycosyltransferase n=1 Tax=Labrys okinawensis TaxID=346911 RepID=UPI0039BC390C